MINPANLSVQSGAVAAYAIKGNGDITVPLCLEALILSRFRPD